MDCLNLRGHPIYSALYFTGYSSSVPRRLNPPPVSVKHRGSESNIQVRPPPVDYDFRRETLADTWDVVRNSYPELMDMVEDGSLVIVKRPETYIERRSDGYSEPELVFVVGTVHVSRISAAQVERVVKTVRPENVVVELCRSRVGIMYGKASAVEDPESNLMTLSGESFVAAIRRSLKLGGQSALMLRLLLAGLSLRLSLSAGVPTGEEFRAARRAAEKVGAQLVLGDRPIEITLQRAWGALQWTEKLKLANALLRGLSSPSLDASEGTLQALKTDDALSAMFVEFCQQFPSLIQPLVYERDRYLAWSLKRSKAVNGSSRVVGVLGRGHMRGVVYALKHDQKHLCFRDLVGTRCSAEGHNVFQVRQVFKNLIVETAIGGVIWFLFDYLSKICR